MHTERTLSRRRFLLGTARVGGGLLLFIVALSSFAQNALTRPARSRYANAEVEITVTKAEDYGIIRPEQIEWQDGPPSLPAGSKIAILEGDPAKEGFFAMRLQLPDGYRIPPHWHPNWERITVISGTFNLGMGEKFDQSSATAMPTGSYSFMHPGMRHFVWATGQTIIQIATIGPWKINYINPADDPRLKK